MVKKALSYYAIQYGGMPMTSAGKERFIKAAKAAGYTDDEIEIYLLTERPIPRPYNDKPVFTVKETAAGITSCYDFCTKNRDKILKHIDEEMQELMLGCAQKTCPLSSFDEAKYLTLRKLKEFIEGLEW